MKMLNGNILTTLPEEGMVKQENGLYIPSESKSYKEVIIVEPDKDNSVSKGDKIYLPIHAGLEVEINNECFLIANKRDIILIV